ncbi:transporter [Flavobacterium agricola]|uniref:Transporter n=1 Tax=Flavobacterium agricola TaxID=2870839 RepID=A0ABY6LXZ3_9FLAO|nr:transporter [Flavobacterium agricola]UYW01109.1 transporter [Flavobacterium agricola]
MKLKILICNLILCVTCNAQITNTINSNRPGKSFGAYAVGKKVIQLETGLYNENKKHVLMQNKALGFGAEIDVRYGAFFEQLEFIGEIDYKTDRFESPYGAQNRSGLNHFRLGAKYLVYDPWKNYEPEVNLYSWKARNKFKLRYLIPAVAVYAGANFKLGNNPFTFPTDASISPKVMVLLQQTLSPKWSVVTNIIADKITTDYPTYGYILTVTHGINYKWSIFAEDQGFKSDYYADNIFRAGAAYLINDNLQVDASFGFNFKDTPKVNMFGIGLSWRNTNKHTPHRIYKKAKAPVVEDTEVVVEQEPQEPFETEFYNNEELNLNIEIENRVIEEEEEEIILE